MLELDKENLEEIREAKRELSKEFYKILSRANYCPQLANEIIQDEYYEKPVEMFYLLRLLYRWNEQQKLERLGGRIYYNFYKWMEENR